MKTEMEEMCIMQESQNRRVEAEQEAKELIKQGRYREACKVLDRLSALEDMEYLSQKDIRPVLHNGRVMG